MDVLKDLNAREGKTIILVTHDAGLAEQYAHRIVTLLDGTIVSEREIVPAVIRDRDGHEA